MRIKTCGHEDVLASKLNRAAFALHVHCDNVFAEMFLKPNIARHVRQILKLYHINILSSPCDKMKRLCGIRPQSTSRKPTIYNSNNLLVITSYHQNALVNNNNIIILK